MLPSANLKIVYNDSTEAFSKLRSAGLNHHLLFITDPYCAGMSNKHCLLTLFLLVFVSCVSSPGVICWFLMCNRDISWSYSIVFKHLNT